MLRVMLLSAALASCSGTAQPPPPAPAKPLAVPPPVDAAVPDAPLDQDLPRLIARSLDMYRDLAAAFAAAATDCAAATTKLDQLATTYREVVVANARVQLSNRAAALREALAPHDAEFSDAAATVMHAPTMSACASDPAFAHALDSLFAPP